jgi:hypothetical protein
MTETEHILSWVNIFRALGEKEMNIILTAIDIYKKGMNNAK